MNEVSIVIEQIVIMAILIIIGITLGRKNIIDLSGIKPLSVILLNIALPATIFNSFAMNINNFSFNKAVFGILLGFIGFGVAYIIGKIFSRFIKEESKGVFISCVLFSNSAFIGYPLIGGIFGDIGVYYASLFQPAFQVFLWTIGVSVLSRSNKNGLKRFLINPNVIAMIIGFIYIIVGINTNYRMNNITSSVITFLSSMTVPISMIVIGLSTSKVKIKEILERKDTYFIAFLRLLLVPLVLIVFVIILKYIGIEFEDKMLLKISIIIMSLPVASSVSAMAGVYGGDIKLASEATIISTILSIITIPIIILIVNMI